MHLNGGGAAVEVTTQTLSKMGLYNVNFNYLHYSHNLKEERSRFNNK